MKSFSTSGCVLAPLGHIKELMYQNINHQYTYRILNSKNKQYYLSLGCNECDGIILRVLFLLVESSYNLALPASIK